MNPWLRVQLLWFACGFPVVAEVRTPRHWLCRTSRTAMGRCATGCVVIAPAGVSFSEEESLQVIRDEFARKAGITLGRGMPLPEVIVEYEDPNAFWSGNDWLGTREPSSRSQPI